MLAQHEAAEPRLILILIEKKLIDKSYNIING
jgi:hypothetical protein